MADNFLNKTGLQYYHNRIKPLFENKIETIKVNGTALPPDAQKAVDVKAAQINITGNARPTATFTQKADGGNNTVSFTVNADKTVELDAQTPDSAFVPVNLATQEYVDKNSGVFLATINTTSASELTEAIEAKKVICVTYGTGYPIEVATLTRVNGNTVTLHTSIFATENGKVYPSVTAYAVTGTTWSSMQGMGANYIDVRDIQDVIPADASDQNPLATQEWVEENGGAVSALKLANGTPLANTNEIKNFLIASPTDKQIPLAFTVDGTYAAAVQGKVRLEEDPETEIDVYRIDLQSKPVQYELECDGSPVPFTPTMYGGTWDIANPVKGLIDEKISAVYKPQGAIAFENLPALSASIEGYVYNITNNFVTTADFIEGAGHAYPAGTNVVCVKHNNIYMWDCLYGIVDMSAYWTSAHGENNTLNAITTAEIDTIVAG